ncbi:unnamed protein product, partial [Staurois parvus]
CHKLACSFLFVYSYLLAAVLFLIPVLTVCSGHELLRRHRSLSWKNFSVWRRVAVQQAYQEQIMHCLQELSSRFDQLQVVSTSSPSVSAPVLAPAAPTPTALPVEHSPLRL